jgi:Cft2 family RNA processing exonuclease
MEGSLIRCAPNSYFGVDYWTLCPSKPVVAYFLTHFHMDHTKGLRPTWNLGPLYCSYETSRLLQDRWPDFEGYIQVVEAGVPVVVQTSPGHEMQVTPLNAEHCLVNARSLMTVQRFAKPLIIPQETVVHSATLEPKLCSADCVCKV